ncbi:MAG: hypothetical protein ACKOAO_00415 [Oxalobacteraceae bacterium]
MSVASLPQVSIKKNTQFPMVDNEDDSSVISTNSSLSDDEFDSKTESASTSVNVSDTDSSSDQANTRPSCPKPVHYIINTLSAVGTFGGLALITTGGMGMTLDKPSANPIANGAMLLSGGALLTASFLGGLYHLSAQGPAE